MNLFYVPLGPSPKNIVFDVLGIERTIHNPRISRFNSDVQFSLRKTFQYTLYSSTISGPRKRNDELLRGGCVQPQSQRFVRLCNDDDDDASDNAWSRRWSRDTRIVRVRRCDTIITQFMTPRNYEGTICAYRWRSVRVNGNLRCFLAGTCANNILRFVSNFGFVCTCVWRTWCLYIMNLYVHDCIVGNVIA